MTPPRALRSLPPEGVSPDTAGPGDRLCLANDRSARTGAACKAFSPFGAAGRG